MLREAPKPVKEQKAVTLPAFKFVGGKLCLDFLNTVGGRTEQGVLRDKLRTIEDLFRWSESSGEPARHTKITPRATRDLLARAIEFRESLYSVLKAAMEGAKPQVADLARINREIATARAHQRLVAASGCFRWEYVKHDKDDTAGRMLWPVVISAAELLVNSDLAMLRQCAGNECGWLFLDTSRNHSRRWCDMKDCGNRAKVARFRERLGS